MNFAGCIVDNFIMLRFLHPQELIFGRSTSQKRTGWLFRKLSGGMSCTISISNRNFRSLLTNGKRPECFPGRPRRIVSLKVAYYATSSARNFAKLCQIYVRIPKLWIYERFLSTPITQVLSPKVHHWRFKTNNFNIIVSKSPWGILAGTAISADCE